MTHLQSENPSSEFTDFVESHNLCLVNFHEDWCPPCVTMDIFLEEIQDDTQIPVLQLSPDAYSELAEQYNVRTIPTILLFSNGDEINRYTGLTDKETIQDDVAGAES